MIDPPIEPPFQSAMSQMDDEIHALRLQLSTALAKLEEIVITEGEDAGVVLLSQEGPTHWDEEVKCEVYNHEYFSPLGDALIELAGLLQAKGDQ